VAVVSGWDATIRGYRLITYGAPGRATCVLAECASFACAYFMANGPLVRLLTRVRWIEFMKFAATAHQNNCLHCIFFHCKRLYSFQHPDQAPIDRDHNLPCIGTTKAAERTGPFISSTQQWNLFMVVPVTGGGGAWAKLKKWKLPAKNKPLAVTNDATEATIIDYVTQTLTLLPY